MCAAAVTTLALLALLAVLVGASDATPEPCRACNGHCRPNIAATVPGKQSHRISQSKAYFSYYYGSDIDIFCSGSNPLNLRIYSGGEYLKAIKFNSTTIRLPIVKPDAGELTFTCVDNDTSCKDDLILSVYLDIYVAGQEVRHTPGGKHLTKFVPLGQNYEVFCSGGQIKSLSMSVEYREGTYKNSSLLSVKAENEKTIIYKTKADSIGEYYYYCNDDVTIYYARTKVEVNYFPEAVNFQCIIHDVHSLDCSWVSLSKYNNFKLFMEESGSEVFLCSDHSTQKNRECKSNMCVKLYSVGFSAGMKYVEMFTKLRMETCNSVFCSNQTFTLKIQSILKLDAPSDFRMLNISSGGVAVAWRRAAVPRFVRLEHRLEYQLLGSAWQQANTSSVLCPEDGHCEFHLNLPCPNAHYKAKLYVKSTAASEDRYWSEPASLFFFTKRQSPGAVVKPECNGKVEQRNRLPFAEEMLYEVEQLLVDEREKDLTLQMQIDTLMAKREQAKELMELLNKM